MRGWLTLGLVVMGSLPCWADVTIIYRKADRLVVGYVFPPMSVQAELRNTLQSELGGSVADYATVVIPDATWKLNLGKQALVNPDLSVSFQENPAITDRKQKQQAAQLKLQTQGISVQDLKDALGE